MTQREIRKQTRDDAPRLLCRKENLRCFSRATRVEAKTAAEAISDCLRVRETQIRRDEGAEAALGVRGRRDRTSDVGYCVG